MDKQEALVLVDEIEEAVSFALTHYTDPTQGKEVELALVDALAMLVQLQEILEADEEHGGV